MSAKGYYFRSWRRIQSGVTQGGAISSFLRLMHINPFVERVVTAKESSQRMLKQVAMCLKLLADDVACFLAQKMYSHYVGRQENLPMCEKTSWRI